MHNLKQAQIKGLKGISLKDKKRLGVLMKQLKRMRDPSPSP